MEIKEQVVQHKSFSFATFTPRPMDSEEKMMEEEHDCIYVLRQLEALMVTGRVDREVKEMKKRSRVAFKSREEEEVAKIYTITTIQ